MNGNTTAQRAFSRSYSGASAAERWLEGLTSEAGFAESLLFAMQVCLEELFCNIVRHSGVTGGAADAVEIAVSSSENCIRMTIEDQGPAFDIRTVEAHPITQSLEEIEPGGLGILLINSFSDSLEYQRSDGRNRVIVTFKC